MVKIDKKVPKKKTSVGVVAPTQQLPLIKEEEPMRMKPLLTIRATIKDYDEGDADNLFNLINEKLKEFKIIDEFELKYSVVFLSEIY